MEGQEKLPFLSHLEELRHRIIRAAVAVGVGFGVAYFFAAQLFNFLILPLKRQLPEDSYLVFTSLPEMFLAYLKVAFIAGLLAAAPFVFYELWMFIVPGLYVHERRYVVPFVTVSSLLFIGGALFGYFVVFPFGFRFFIGFASEAVHALPSVKQYLTFSLRLLIAFGLVFEMPVVIFFLARIGLVTPEALRKKRKYAILLGFVIAAILTPPDVITQCMMALPLLVLYEVSIWVAHLARKQRRKARDTDETPSSQTP